MKGWMALLRIGMLALIVGSTAGLTIGSYFRGFNSEGVIMGLIAIVSIVTITAFFYIHEKKQLTKSYNH